VTNILYVYAIGRAGHPRPDDVQVLESGPLAAFYAPVNADDYSQEAIDARSKDVEWLGAIGYRHQEVMAKLMRGGTVIPLRAFTLFANEGSLRAHLDGQRELFAKILDRLDGKQEWTVRIEFEPQKWSDALVDRVDSLKSLTTEIAQASSGKAFLLRKKMDEERKKASREAEQQIVGEIESTILGKLACDSVAESRQQRSGAFPQINVLINRDEESRLEELRQDLEKRYAAEGVTLALTGPWPPYTFASLNDGRTD
jgi:hypothetical protein